MEPLPQHRAISAAHAVYNLALIDFPRACVNTLAYFHKKYHGNPRAVAKIEGRRDGASHRSDPRRKNEVNPTFVNKDPAHFRRGGITAVAV